MKPSRHHSFFISVALRPLFYLIFAPEHPAGAYKADTKTHVRTLAHPGHRHTFNTRSSGSILKTPQSHCMSHRPIGFVLLFAVPDQWTSAWIEPMRLLISGCDQSSSPRPRLQSTCARMWPRPRVVKTLGVPRLWLVVRRLARRLISPRDGLMVVRVFFPPAFSLSLSLQAHSTLFTADPKTLPLAGFYGIFINFLCVHTPRPLHLRHHRVVPASKPYGKCVLCRAQTPSLVN